VRADRPAVVSPGVELDQVAVALLPDLDDDAHRARGDTDRRELSRRAPSGLVAAPDRAGAADLDHSRRGRRERKVEGLGPGDEKVDDQGARPLEDAGGVDVELARIGVHHRGDHLGRERRDAAVGLLEGQAGPDGYLRVEAHERCPVEWAHHRRGLDAAAARAPERGGLGLACEEVDIVERRGDDAADQRERFVALLVLVRRSHRRKCTPEAGGHEGQQLARSVGDRGRPDALHAHGRAVHQRLERGDRGSERAFRVRVCHGLLEQREVGLRGGRVLRLSVERGGVGFGEA
jgi:hypothetical protein